MRGIYNLNYMKYNYYLVTNSFFSYYMHRTLNETISVEQYNALPENKFSIPKPSCRFYFSNKNK